MGFTPKAFKVVVADPLDRTGKAEERRALCESVFGHRGRRLRHVGKSRFMNLGGPASLSAGCGLQRGESPLERQQEFRPRHSSGEPGNDRGAKGVAERGSGQ